MIRTKYRLSCGVAVGAAASFCGSAAHAAQLDVAEQHVTARGYLVVPKSSVARAEDAGKRVHTNTKVLLPYKAFSGAVNPAGSPPYSGYDYVETPASLACVYKLVTVTTGCNPDVVTKVPSKGSQAIAIVDAYDSPNALADLVTFSKQFGLKTPTSSTFKVVYASGSEPAEDSGWEGEEALDVQWAHAMAPDAKLYLVEAASDSDSDLYAAEQVAAKLVAAAGGGEVSNSWGEDEYSGETEDDSYFSYSDVVFFASTGDYWSVSYPATSKNVVAVGGSAIARNYSTGAFVTELPWTQFGYFGEGVGVSAYEKRPSFQSGVSSVVGSYRGIPDIVADADPEVSPLWVYISDQDGWFLYGGTSAASPIIAGIANASGKFKASTAREEALIYDSNGTDLKGMAKGYCGYYDEYVGASTYNLCSGEGSPRGYGGE
jgi:kumamolisin